MVIEFDFGALPELFTLFPDIIFDDNDYPACSTIYIDLIKHVYLH